MRLLKFLEATKYPKTMTPEQIMDYIRTINREPADFEIEAGASPATHTAYMKKLIGKNTQFVLTEVPVSNYDTEMYADQDLVDKYYEMMTSGQTDYPPIVVNEKGRILDGAHRLAALEYAGVDTVRAYKPAQSINENQQAITTAMQWAKNSYGEMMFGHKPEDFEWTVHQNFPVSEFGDEKEWIDLFGREIEAVKYRIKQGSKSAEKDLSTWENIMRAGARKPVMALKYPERKGVRTGGYEILDGYHRIGATFKSGRSTLPAVIGVVKPKTDESQMTEAKQVGILYHYTSVSQAIGILHDNALIGNPSKDVEGSPSTVSFTRNQNYHNTVEFKPTGGSARLAFDGDKMSNQFKLSPVMGSVGRKGWPMGAMGRPNNETEVVAFADSIPVKPYLVSIDVNADEVSWSSFIDNFVAQAKEDYGIAVGTIKNNRNIPFVDLSGGVSTAQKNWEKLGLKGQKGMDLSSLVTEAVDGWITAYHGGADFEGDFKLGHQGKGENNLILGPGIYFAENPDIAKRYARYADYPAMYSVEINMSNIYDPVHGEPKNLRGIGDKMAQALGFQSVDDMPTSADSFKYGKWPVGNIVAHLGRDKALALFRKFGLDGLYEILPDGTREIAVYNPAAIRNKQKIEGEANAPS